MLRPFSCLVLIVVFLPPLSVVAERTGAELERLQGVWRAESRVVDGVKIGKESSPTILIAGDLMTITFRFGDKQVCANFTIDAKAVNGASAGKTVRGIYKLADDRLTLCIPDNPTQPCPRKFASPLGSQLHLMTLVRERPNAGSKPSVPSADRTVSVAP